MFSCRWASANRSSIIRMARGLLSGDAAPDTADGETEAREVPGGQDVAGHDLAGREYVGEGRAVRAQDTCLLGDRRAHVGERDSRAHGYSVVGRGVDRLRPVFLGRLDALGGAVVQASRIE